MFSTARSGSTWLAADILGWRNRVRIVDEPGFGLLFAPLRWDAERFADLRKIDFYVQSGRPYESGLAPRGIPNDLLPLFERHALGGPSGVCSPAYFHDFLETVRRSVVQHLVDHWGLMHFQRFVVKMPNESHAADYLLQALPEARAIHLIRDGRDVMRSRFGGFGSEILRSTNNAALRQYAIGFYSHLWNFQNDIIESACASHNPARILRVHYERLHANRLNQSRAIFDWVGLDLPKNDDQAFLLAIDIASAPEAEVGLGNRRGDARVGAFSEAFSATEIQRMEQIMGPVLERFGYQLLGPKLATPMESSPAASANTIGALQLLRAKLAAGDEIIEELQAEFDERTKWAQQLHEDNFAKSALIVALQNQLADRTAWAIDLDQLCAAKDRQIAELQRHIDESKPPKPESGI